ncbi:hypothetical protein F2Q70_00041841 [Brassica cretica]|uniref:Uncharacterized protein n=1 Tax=Brassica cretica TaxID=69181 RepID=A0A8S9K4S6_BRACR|nr:hypothetical protein F2Q70_00041841 [Brassica cretica]
MGLHTLRLATVPLTFSTFTSRLFLKPIPPNTLQTLGQFSRHVQPRKPFLVRAFSASAAVQETPPTQASDSSGIIPVSICLASSNHLTDSFYGCEFSAARPQWKASIDFKWIRDNKEAVEINIKNRNSNADLGGVIELYENMVNLQKEVEGIREERNNVAKKMKGKLEPSERERLVEEGKSLKESLVTLEEDLVKLQDELQQVARSIPNMTHPDVPIGGEDSSAIRKEVGSPREFTFPIKDHLQLGKDLDLIDFDSASEVYTLSIGRDKAEMVKMTLIARVTDGLPLAEGLDDGRDLPDSDMYKQQVKSLFKNLSRENFSYIIEGRVCYLTMCDRSYPKKLAFQYLEDLKNEFERVNGPNIETAARPYAFIKFDTFIQKTKKLYQDTRTQRNIAKLNDELYEVHQIMTRNVQEVLGVGEKLDQVSEMSSRLTSESRIYADKAKDLNRQALIRKWAPVAIVLGVVFLLFWVKNKLCISFTKPARPKISKTELYVIISRLHCHSFISSVIIRTLTICRDLANARMIMFIAINLQGRED